MKKQSSTNSIDKKIKIAIIVQLNTYRKRKEVGGVSEISDFFKFLRSLGAKEIAPGRKHRRWQIGNKVLPVPSNLSGTRAFRNYEVLANRMALEEGLIRPPEKRGGKPTSGAPAKSQLAQRPDQLQRAAPGTREDLEAWNQSEAERWRLSCQEETKSMSEALPKSIVRVEERLPIVERIMREADKPLTRSEILKLAGWPENAHQAIGRVLTAYPSRFRRTRSVKRNERWELVVEEPPQALPPPMVEPAPEAPPTSRRHQAHENQEHGR
ncbi:MAG: hypothetical protein HY220_02400 [Candidatus Sungbacteria bacterium]|uniref:Uncharacterized protein n=1 Tax=Candidatus Sungiibacteriota bacterium TaxID=2750080 RepID=A0A9D6LQ35_9BACT|nr:hypothetical protein [Candidatus Sungbacteria bacterium]